MAVGDEKWHFPLLLGGAGLLVFMGMKSSSGGGATVIGQVAAKDIIAQNEAVNANDTAVKLKGIDAVTSYYNTRQNNDTAIKEATLAGANAITLQGMVINGQEQLATIGANRDLGLGRLASDTAIQQAKITGDTQVQITNATLSAQRAESDNAASVAKAQSKNSLWGSIVGNITNGITSFFTSSPSPWSSASLPAPGAAGSSGWVPPAAGSTISPNALDIPIVVPYYSSTLNRLPTLTGSPSMSGMPYGGYA